jgi:sec-independent protein translocase protein TatA
MIEGLLQPTHLLIILAVAVFVFGPKKIPELGKSLAEGIRSFQDGVKSATEVDHSDKDKSK